ncbi:HEPN domain-containing protein [Marinobacterium aestuariivivens]|uniref:HEPN domain-containing protein n=1 Tax=Marinobacterium aestuariivivens TaxID=1698799 RepID=A0ABW2A2Y8_9GAMM
MNPLSLPEQHGIFWLPDHEENEVPGRLYCNTSGQLELEVAGSLTGETVDMDSTKIKRILGITQRGKPITLDNCFFRNRNISFPGIGVSKIRINQMYIGAHFDKDEPIEFEKISFHSTALDEWMKCNPINVAIKNGENKSIHINYSFSASPKWQLKNGGELTLDFECLMPQGWGGREVKIAQKTWISINYNKLLPVNDALSYIWRFIDFASFSCDKNLYIESIRAYRSDITEPYKESTRMAPIEIFLNLSPNDDIDFSELSEPFILLKFDDISDNFGHIISSWLTNYEKYDSTFNLYFATKSAKGLYLDNRFLMLAQAVESLHRRMSPDSTYTTEEYDELSKSLLNSVPEKYREWVEARLRYGNELNLRSRIKSLFNDYKSIFGGSKKIKSNIDKIVNTRNYLTHYDNSLKRRSASGDDLYKLCLVLEILLQIHFCKLLEFDNKKIQEIFNKSQSIIKKKSRILQ